MVRETVRAATVLLDPADWAGHRAGQHVDVRLTAEDGYQAQRSYSIASAPEDEHLALTIEVIEDGEVSPYLAEELRAGDELELRGPIGGYFAWEDAFPGPVLLVAGGSGIVPLRSMLRHRAAAGSDVEVRLVYSARALSDVIYRSELEGYARDERVDVQLTLTREWPLDWSGRRGRVDRAMLDELAFPPDPEPLTYVCGPSAFVEAVAGALVASGAPAGRVRTERFGPSGT